MTEERVEVIMRQSHDEGASLKLVLWPNKVAELWVLKLHVDKEFKD